MIISSRNNVWGGPKPTSLKDLKDKGIKRIINLESGVYDLIRVYDETYYKDHMQFPADFGMSEYLMPCSDIKAPAALAVGKILELVFDKVPTYIHCLSGRDRTGFVGAVIKMRIDGMSFDDAVKWWREVRHPWYFYWEPALKEWV